MRRLTPWPARGRSRPVARGSHGARARRVSVAVDDTPFLDGSGPPLDHLAALDVDGLIELAWADPDLDVAVRPTRVGRIVGRRGVGLIRGGHPPLGEELAGRIPNEFVAGEVVDARPERTTDRQDRRMTGSAGVTGEERELVGLADEAPTAVRVAPCSAALSGAVIERGLAAVAHEVRAARTWW